MTDPVLVNCDDGYDSAYRPLYLIITGVIRKITAATEEGVGTAGLASERLLHQA